MATEGCMWRTFILATVFLAQTAPTEEDLWRTEIAFERAITAKQHDAARPMFHADFLGVDADGSRYTADDYFGRRAAESLFFDVEDEFHPGGGVVIGTVLVGNSVQRFSHVWLVTPQGWRLVAAQASPILDPPANASSGATRPGGDETTYLKDQAVRGAAETAIVEAQRGLLLAENASDAKAWAALTDDHFWALSPNGAKASKGPRFTQIGRPRAPTPLPIVHHMEIRIYGDLAIMRMVQEPVRPPSLRGTRVWVKHGDVWQQALNHQTFLAEPASK